MIFFRNGFLGGLSTFPYFSILKPQNNCKTNAPSVFKLKVNSAAFHALGIMDGVVPAPSMCICLFHSIGFRGGMVSSMRPYLYWNWALSLILGMMAKSVH
jgi:hypothetical protein